MSVLDLHACYIYVCVCVCVFSSSGSSGLLGHHLKYSSDQVHPLALSSLLCFFFLAPNSPLYTILHTHTGTHTHQQLLFLKHALVFIWFRCSRQLISILYENLAVNLTIHRVTAAGTLFIMSSVSFQVKVHHQTCFFLSFLF